VTTTQISEAPSSKQLIRATLMAAAIAGIVLVTIVMPAEYGLDPVGSGRALGIFRPRVEVAATDQPASAVADESASGSLLKQAAPFRTDEMTLELASGEGAEIKAKMRQGERFVFTWTAKGGPVDFDMHGDRVNAAQDEFTSYWKDEEQESGHGAFEAPFAGNHGWFWQNLNAETVTIRLRTSGYYEHIGRVGAK
jgi:hypothetical protein